jgi:hypothetical protein
MLASPSFHADMARLLDSLCERRLYGPLRVLLPYYPMPNGFTDEVAELARALKTVRAQLSTQLSSEEFDLVVSLQHHLESALDR